MGAIIVKDLVENLRAWLVFTLGPAALLAVALHSGASPEKLEQIKGVFQTLPLACGFLFVHTVILNERKRRHLILLRSLPISDAEILLAKHLSIVVLVLSIAGFPQIVAHGLGVGPSLGSFVVQDLYVVFYAAVLCFFTVAFRSPLAIAIPLYLGVVMVVAGSGLEGLVILGRRVSWLWTGTVAPAVICVPGSTAVFLLTLAVFRRRELDL